MHVVDKQVLNVNDSNRMIEKIFLCINLLIVKFRIYFLNKRLTTIILKY